jgi:L-malate glycosyltransferase
MRKGFRVLILTPTVLPQATGNAMTAERWRRLLVARGASVKVLATQELKAPKLLDVIERFAPHVVHGHHASKSGIFLLDSLIADHCACLPWVVSLAGTDIHSEKNSGSEKMLQVLRRAQVIIAQNDWLMPWFEQNSPDLCSRMTYVSKSTTSMGDAPWDLRKACEWPADHIIFFHPAGIRPVKGNLECLSALEGVYRSRPRLRVIFAGPVLDSTYGNRFMAEIKRLSDFARWFPVIPPAAMAAAYASADLVLNASSSEGLSNAVLEAMAAGRPVLAADIVGNRYPLLGNGCNAPSGLLYNPGDPGDFRCQAIRLIDHEELRIDLGQAGRARISAFFRPEAEADGLLNAYAMAAEGLPSQ